MKLIVHGIKSNKIVTGCILQLLDLPGIIEGAKDGKGRGRQVIAVARTCSLIFIVLDVLKPLGHKRLIEHELEGFGLRLNKQPPNITFKKKDKGGINLQTMVRKLCGLIIKIVYYIRNGLRFTSQFFTHKSSIFQLISYKTRYTWNESQDRI